MKRPSATHLVLAVALAVLLPFEQAHCAWMAAGRAANSPSPTPSTGHACCPLAAPNEAAPAPAPPCRSCEQQVSLTASSVLPAAHPATGIAPALADLPAPASLRLPPLPIAIAALVAADVGLSPRIDAPGAHLLRAPPVSS